MNLWKTIGDSAMGIVNYANMFINKNGPGIAVACGIVVGIASTVYACVKTLEAPEIIEEHKAAMAETVPDQEPTDEGEDTPEVSKAKVYFTTAGKFVKLYWLPAAGLITSAALELWGFHKISTLNAQLMSANAGLMTLIANYRANVAKYVGDEAIEHALYTGRDLVFEDADGNVVEEFKCSNLGDPNEYGAYPMIFDKSWHKFNPASPIANYYSVKGMEQFVTMKVRRNGVCTLNELRQFDGAVLKELDCDGYLWGFAPKNGQPKELYEANFGIPSVKMFENGPFGPPTEARIDMCLPLVWLGDKLPRKSFRKG